MAKAVVVKKKSVPFGGKETKKEEAMEAKSKKGGNLPPWLAKKSGRGK